MHPLHDLGRGRRHRDLRCLGQGDARIMASSLEESCENLHCWQLLGMSASRQDSFSALLPSDDEMPVGTPRKDKKNPPFAGGLRARSAGLEPATF